MIFGDTYTSLESLRSSQHFRGVGFKESDSQGLGQCVGMILERRNVFQLDDPCSDLLDHEVDSHHEVLDILRAAARERRGQRG